MSKEDDKNPEHAPFEMSPLRESAMQMHELYTELRNAGFTRYEALTIICATVTGKNE